ncbi:MAG: DNA adenine methylase [Myxococcota bacterium]|jgi:DNA adenine methylase|nr:DNA adenine methylase [Myxococcota bacterium]
MTTGKSVGSDKAKSVRGVAAILPRPFLKWVGGKGQLVSRLRELLPSGFHHYFEPFVGGGALFFDVKPGKATLSDLNHELMACYEVVQNDVAGLIAMLADYVYDKDRYYEVRSWDPQNLEPTARCARTIYLNKTGFNGLYRVNSKGLFNVPFGRHVSPTLCDEKNLRACAKALQGVTLACKPFEHVLEAARSGDFVYFDPPYIPVSRSANFTAYARNGFDMNDQEKLAQVFDELAQRNVNVMLSNSDVPWMHERYARHTVRLIRARRNVNCNSASRGAINEVVVTSY